MTGNSMNAVTARLSSKRQLSIPARMARALGIGPGSTVILRLEEDRIVLLPAPKSYTDAFAGSLAGTYDDPDRYIREERGSWQD